MQAHEQQEIRNCHINIGVGTEVSIAKLAEMVQKIIRYKGLVHFDPSMLDGTTRKLLDVSRLRSLGFQEKVDLQEGIAKLYFWYTHQS